MDRLLTYQQAAVIYAVAPRTVRHWADKGAVEVVRTPGGQPRVKVPAQLVTPCVATDGNRGN